VINSVSYPSLYQVNTRVRLRELSNQLNCPATLNDIPDTELDEWVNLGFHWIYFLGVWETGLLGRNVSRSHPGWRREYEELLSDLQEDDICALVLPLLVIALANFSEVMKLYYDCGNVFSNADSN
jgi:hypothetical protein